MTELEGLRVMVLDDEPIVGRRLKPALEKLGLQVEVFVDPAAAMERLQEQRFDVVVSDLKMRGLDGWAVIDRVRAAYGRAVKVVLITAFATEEVAREALARGAFEVLGKPFRSEDLRAAVERAARALADDPDGRPGEP